ncbi:hypothetical protein FACS1894217_15810 [Clostridia bacterium]|nr:hypothetical protein FACS1894217_15810 [Clostridia bacterium]
MSHYFIADNSLKSEPQTFSYYYKSQEYSFTTDTGVFSVGKMDPNTHILLANLPQLHGSLLDMGCGYGAIGIVLAKEYNLELTQVDINPKAITLTAENCEKNGVISNAVVSDCFAGVSGDFDTIIINPPIHAGKKVVFDMYEGSRFHLKPGGKLYIVILKKHGADSTIARLRELFGAVETLYKKQGCFVLCCVKI